MNFGKNLDNNHRHKAPERIVLPSHEQTIHIEATRRLLENMQRPMALFPQEAVEPQIAAAVEYPDQQEKQQFPTQDVSPVAESVNPFYSMTIDYDKFAQEALRRNA